MKDLISQRYSVCKFCLQGSALNFFAPAMEDLRVKFDSTVDSMAFVFTVNLIAYGVGALSSKNIQQKVIIRQAYS